MKNLLSLATVAGLIATTFSVAAPAAHAEEFVARYTYLINGVQGPSNTVLRSTLPGNTMVLEQPAVIENTITAPAVVGATKAPIMVEHRESLVPHIFHLGLWPLVDFSIF